MDMKLIKELVIEFVNSEENTETLLIVLKLLTSKGAV